MIQTAPACNLLRYFDLLRLTGPLSRKEPRVASRRRRSYALRVGCVLLLGLLVLSGWYSMVGLPRVGRAAIWASRAPVMSTHTTVRIVAFQFVVAQLVAAAMLRFSLSVSTVLMDVVLGRFLLRRAYTIAGQHVF